MAGKPKYERFLRAWNGLMVLALLVTIVAATLADAGFTGILFRSIVLIAALAFLGRVLVRFWGIWEEMQQRGS